MPHIPGKPRKPILDRLYAMVLCDTTTRCWVKQGYITWSGYGMIKAVGGRKSGLQPIHRFAYEQLVGPIPAGYEIHHKCGNKACANPEHLLATDRRTHLRELSPTNIAYKNARKTHCPKGHALTPDNLVPSVLKRGLRNCLTCKRRVCGDYMKRLAASGERKRLRKIKAQGGRQH